MGKLRATSPSEKTIRRQAILDAAAFLFDRWSFDDITMQRLAVTVGLSKGTLYLYFSSKESIFLELLDGLMMKWHHTVDGELQRSEAAIDIPRLAQILARAFGSLPRLVRLYALLHPVLETNIDVGTATASLRNRHDRFRTTADLMGSRISGLTVDQAFEFLVLLDPIITGFAQTSISSPAVSRAFETEGLSRLKIDPAKVFQNTLTALLTHSTRAEQPTGT